ncbi:MAG: T9SS type A sorting domain-containing protein [Bacteroidetes bacterium]|nr:T9SS type A sorting domain-containing protein [Bacteroidota bacterium]
MTMIHDANGLNYLYVANKEAGVRIYDITNLSSPSLSKEIPVSSFGNLEPMNLSQSGNYLYIALGNHFNSSQNAGMAIIDVSSPKNAIVVDWWQLPSSGGGSGIVKTEGNYAYLGAMKNGLIILDITDKSDIKFISQFIPDINFPTANPNPNLYNARGMEVKNDIVYLCYDAGGIRLINVKDKQKPKETGRFSNPALNGKPRAYNNLILDDTLLYVAVDYCGLEILNIKDTSKIKISGKWNPYNCPSSNWFTSPVHANEIQFNKSCKTLFLSVGKTDMIVLDVSDISNPDSCNYYGGTANDIGTWGIGLYKNQIYLSYVCSLIPFSSNWAGIKILEYTPCQISAKEIDKNRAVIFPNPTIEKITVIMPPNQVDADKIIIYDSYGKILNSSDFYNKIEISTFNLKPGIYFLKIFNNNKNICSTYKFEVL